MGAAVYEETMYGPTLIGIVDRTFDSIRRPGMVHSIRVDDWITLGNFRFQTILYWSRGRWRNRLNRQAEYRVCNAQVQEGNLWTTKNH